MDKRRWILFFNEVPTKKLPRPGLILLDLNLPVRNGIEVLAMIKEQPDIERIPVVVLSSSSNQDHIRSCYDLHVNSYVCKPVDWDVLFQYHHDHTALLVEDLCQNMSERLARYLREVSIGITNEMPSIALLRALRLQKEPDIHKARAAAGCQVMFVPRAEAEAECGLPIEAQCSVHAVSTARDAANVDWLTGVDTVR